jgi:chromosome segregation ATPase
VILVEALALEAAPPQIETIVKERGIRLKIPPLLEGVEKDIRRNVHPPFEIEETKHLSSFIEALLKHVFDHLSSLQESKENPLSLPIAFQKLQTTGEEILDDMKPYAMLAEHHFKEEIGRLERPTDEVSKEIYELTNKAKGLKKRIVEYLQNLGKFLAEADI